MIDLSYLQYMKPWQWAFIAAMLLTVILTLVGQLVKMGIDQKSKYMKSHHSQDEAFNTWTCLRKAYDALEVIEQATNWMMVIVTLGALYIIITA